MSSAVTWKFVFSSRSITSGKYQAQSSRIAQNPERPNNWNLSLQGCLSPGGFIHQKAISFELLGK